MKFPVPFAGITKRIECEDQAQFHALCLMLVTCHSHNFAVESERLALYVSEAGAACATAWYGQRDTPPPRTGRANGNPR